MGTESSPFLTLPDGTQPLSLGSGHIKSLLGSGAISNVYKIWNPQLETFRAVKLMKPDVSTDSRQRFQTEMKIMAALSHPNIVEIHSVGEWNGLSFIEMEYIEGYTLAEIIEKKGALPIAACTALCIMVARALTYAHNKDYVLFGKSYHGIIHRDIKPSNLMVTKDGRVKLMDFGIARPVETSLMTMDGAVMGTMQYLAPEQIDGKNVGITADIYALGTVFYEMLAGFKAFPQKNLSQLMAAKTGNNFVPLTAYRIKIPQNMKKLVSQCMMHDPKKRIPSASMTLKEIEHAHRRITLDSPEEVIRSLLRSPINEKTVLLIRKPIPVRLLACIVAGVIAVAAAYGLIVSNNKRVAKASALNIPAPPSKTTLAPPEPVPSPGAPVQTEKREPPATVMKPKRPVALKGSLGPGAPQVKRTNQFDNKENANVPVTVESFEKEMESGSFDRATQLYGKLPTAATAQKNIQLLYLRALNGLGKTAEAGNFMKTHTIDDGEFFLMKAKYLIRMGDYDQSLSVLEKAIAVRSQYMEPDVIRRDYLYCRAKCLSHRFDQAPSPERRKAALDGWFEVKNAVRRYPRHMYFEEAVLEMQRIGDVSRSPERTQGKKETSP